MLALTAGDGLALLDAGRGRAMRPMLVPVRLDLAVLGRAGQVPALLRGLVRGPARRAAAAGTAGWRGAA